MQKIITCLGFNDQAEEAVNFYTSTIRNSKILTTTRYGDAGPGPKGSLLAATFLLDGQEFMALNGGPPFKFSIGMSIVIKCETQAEIDSLFSSTSRRRRSLRAQRRGRYGCIGYDGRTLPAAHRPDVGRTRIDPPGELEANTP